MSDAEKEGETHKFHVSGMTCGACVSSIEKMLGKQEGILDVTVALLAERLVLRRYGHDWAPGKKK